MLVVVIVVVVMVLVVVVAVIRPTLHIAYGRLHAANLELHIANGIPHAAYVINIAYPIAQTACRRPHIPYGTPHAAYHIPVALVAEVLLLIVVVVVVVVVVAVGTTRLRELDSPSTHALPRLIATFHASEGSRQNAAESLAGVAQKSKIVVWQDGPYQVATSISFSRLWSTLCQVSDGQLVLVSI